MGEKGKAEELVDRIEKLIVDGNKEVLERIGKVEERLEEAKLELKDDIKSVENKLDAVHTSLKNEIRVTAYAVKDEIKEKIDDHVRLAHAR
jgi:uncharacterized protein YjbJ (UPF0337 family)